MSAKEEIKNLLTEDLKKSSQYAECMLIKQYIINQISNPGIVNMHINYYFSQTFNDDELSIFKLCFKIVFGWIENDCNNNCIGLDISKFLD
jgi:hypothetical protein